VQVPQALHTDIATKSPKRIVSYETVREWCFKIGQTYANGVRRKSPRPGDRWHFDESVPHDQRTPRLPLACSGVCRMKSLITSSNVNLIIRADAQQEDLFHSHDCF
jgi:hypothetical protein